MGKTLIFEGAGSSSSEYSSVGNCRIRTRIKNNDGRIIYLEMGGFQTGKHTPKQLQQFNFVGRIDHCFYEDAKWDCRKNSSKELSELERVNFEYTQENILKLVNEKLNCSFGNMQVINDNSIRVHNTKETLCSSCDKITEPYKDIEINISELANVKPIVFFERSNCAKYHLSYESVSNILYIKKWIEEHPANSNNDYENLKYYACFRWDEHGIINNLEVSSLNGSFVNMGLGAEDVSIVIDMILKDSLQMAI